MLLLADYLILFLRLDDVQEICIVSLEIWKAITGLKMTKGTLSQILSKLVISSRIPLSPQVVLNILLR